MRIFARLRSWGKSAFHRSNLEEGLDAELRFHIEAYAHDLSAAGVPPDEALRQARMELGTMAGQKEDCRASLGLRLWDGLGADIRYGCRMMLKDRLVTLIAVVSLALGIGANTAIFSVAQTVLFDALGVPHPEQLRLLSWSFRGPNQPVESIWGSVSNLPNGDFTSTSFSYPEYQALERRKDLFANLIAFKNTDKLLTVLDGQADVNGGEMVSGNFFQGLGVHPVVGRAILPADAVEGAPPVVVLSYEFWINRFAGSTAILGKTIDLNAVPVTVVGVAPKQFIGPQIGSAPRLFLPLTLQQRVDPNFEKDQLHNGNSWWLLLMGRLRQNVTDARAQAELTSIFRQTARTTLRRGAQTDMNRMRLLVNPGDRGDDLLKNRLARPTYILMFLVALVLLLACANVANLLLARSTARQREISVRLALGASRGRIIRQMLTESLLLSGAGGVLGLLLAYSGRNAIAHLMRAPVSGSFDLGVLAFTLVICVGTGLLFGIAPALQASRAAQRSELNETVRMTSSRSKATVRKVLVTVQIAVSTVLLIGAGLFLRTLHNLTHTQLGFQPDHLLLFDLDLPLNRYSEQQRLAAYREITDRITAIPGVRDVTVSGVSLVSGSTSTSNFDRNDQPRRDGTKAWENPIGTDFFRTVGIPLLSGRPFNAHDTASSPSVAIINQKLAHAFFPHENPIGKTFNDQHTLIVGICGDSKFADLRSDAPPTYYIPYTQAKLWGDMVYNIRTSAEPRAVVTAVRKAVASIDRDLPLLDVRTQREQINTSLSQERLFAILTSGFGGLALLLGCVGIYGVIAYAVTRRTNEIGIRMALGAQRAQVVRLVIAEGFGLTCLGIAVGSAIALSLTRIIKAMLYQVAATDALNLIASAGILLLCAAAAMWLPARRASLIEPMQALRHE